MEKIDGPVVPVAPLDDNTTIEIAKLSNQIISGNDDKMMEITQGKLQKLRALISVASDTSSATLALELPVNDESLMLCCSQSGDSASLSALLAKNKGELTLFNEGFVACCEFGHVGILFVLLKGESDNIDPGFENSKALRVACKNGHTSIVNFLLHEPDIDPTVFDNFPIRIASENGHTQVVKVLLSDDRVNPSAQNNYALLESAKNGHIEVMKLLMKDERVDPTCQSNSILLNVISFRRLDIIQLLLTDKRVNPKDSLSRIYSAITLLNSLGHTEFIEQLYSILNIPKKEELVDETSPEERNLSIERQLKSQNFSSMYYNTNNEKSSSESDSSEEEIIKLNILFLQHDKSNELNYIKNWIEEKGHSLNGLKVWESTEFPALDSFDWLILMGGDLGANDEDKYEWIKKEKEFIKLAIEKGKFVLGICLGSQLISCALGSTVKKHTTPEIGWMDLEILSTDSQILNSFKNVKVFSCHNDTWDLPSESILLGSTSICQNQAFSYDNDRVIGLQFHPEVTPEGARLLLSECKENIPKFDLDNEIPFKIQNDALKQLLNTQEELILFQKLF